ncbi:hypothetical protein B0H67DRAFT_587086 [Lasiosphaeris hirsuta]|uniref:Uncharacterized protein n=1 Tax=Lasiosphaeris hirsuta TaxID=260670 RepID=A0AA40DQ95_9PEZI|nr:hypothetical protein B0H67DRAFT_587086 [Lasiosphaeris hirsuta]
MRAIWAQGWLYTALPVSLMTLYRTLWEGVVAAVAERQPYVELMRQGGGAPEKTVLLDYRAEWSITVPFKAMRMGHYFLGLCMAMSVVSSFGLVPATAFLFTTQTSSPVYTVPLRSVSELNYSAIHQPAPGVPSGQKALDWAAATSLMSAPPMAWTNGTNAYSAFELARDLPTSETADQTPISVESTAYFLQPNCVVLREGVDFTSTLQRAAIPGLNGVHLSARGSDRGCGFDYTLLFDLRESFFTKFQPMAAKTFQTINCKSRSTESRVALIAGRYVGDRIDDHSVSNVSLVSCNPRYWALPGVLNATVALSSSGAVPPTSIDGFSGDWSRAVEYTQGDHLYIEASFLDPLAFDPTLPIQVPTNELARHVFELALQSNTDAPLDPVALTKSMSALLERAYTAMAATMLSVPMAHPTSQLGFVTVSETRVVVVQGVAYFVMVVLGLTALLLIWITLSVRHESAALFEEPVGLISIAGIAQRSADLTREVGTLNAGSGFRGEFREAALSSAAFKSTMWAYDQTEKHIYDSNKSGLRTARP